MFNGTAHSFFVSVSCLALLLSMLSGLYRVHRLRVSSLCPVVRRHFLPFFFLFGKWFVLCVFSSSLPPSVLSFLSSAYWLERK